MNHAQFIIGLLNCVKEPSKKEIISLIHYLYGDFSIIKTFHGLHILIILRDKSKLWIEEEESVSAFFSFYEGELTVKEWKFDSLPWEDRVSTKERSQGEGRSDKLL